MSITTPFRNRFAAGQALAARLLACKFRPPVAVVALPRGGVPVAVPVAIALKAPLDLWLVRKIGAPWQGELALAAVAEGESAEVVVDEAVRTATGADASYIQAVAARERQEILRRQQVYRDDRPAPDLAGRTVVVVDDGLATGTTMRAALRSIRLAGPAAIVVAVPVASADGLALVQPEADEVVCLASPTPFEAVGRHYVDFTQVSDNEVLAGLRAVRARMA
ncbi:MAG: phosphoribosyltransferase [Rhizobacter sp.]